MKEFLRLQAVTFTSKVVVRRECHLCRVAAWQVILCDPIWHVSSRSGVVLVAQTAIRFLTLP